MRYHRPMRGWMFAFAVTAVACGKSGGSTYMHTAPNFEIAVPSDLVAGKEDANGESGSIQLDNKDGSRVLALVWARSGSPLDPGGAWERHHRTDGGRTIVEEGDLPGGGKFITIDRGPLTFAYALVTSGGYTIECTTSDRTAKPDPALLGACKTLAGY